MTCEVFFIDGLWLAIAAFGLALLSLSTPPVMKYCGWAAAALLFIASSLYVTVPWLMGYTQTCVEINYKLSLAKMPPARVQLIAAGSGAHDSHSVRSHTYRVGWFGHSQFRDIRN